MKSERRNSGSQAQNPEQSLSEVQRLSLRKLEEFGWSLLFVRRPLFQDIIPVMRHPDTNTMATLDVDGMTDMLLDLKVRA